MYNTNNGRNVFDKNALKLYNLTNSKFKAKMIFVSDAIRDVDDGRTHFTLQHTIKVAKTRTI